MLDRPKFPQLPEGGLMPPDEHRSDARIGPQRRSLAALQKLVRPVIVALPAAGLVVGLAAVFAGWTGLGGRIFAAATVPVLLALLLEIVVSLRRGDVGLDIIAALAMLAALIFAEYLAAVVV